MSGDGNRPGRVVIIGAGPTGLGAAYRLAELGHRDVVVIEARDHPGGLASSYRDGHGFTWDVGGHVGHSHYRYYDEVVDRVLGDRRCEHERQARVWLRGRFVPYPFQYNLHRLDRDDCARALRDLARARAGGPVEPDAGFDAWIRGTFGDTIAELFMLPYNRKVWGHPLSELSSDWIRDRVPPPDLERVRRNVEAGRDDGSWGANRRFFYPLEGGTGTLWRGVADLLPEDGFVWKRAVASIDAVARRLVLDDGTSRGYDTLISSMPLDVLCRMCRGLEEGARRAADSLLYSSCHIIGVGLRGPRPQTLSRPGWIYFPEPEVPFYRLTVLSSYSPNNVPPGDGHWSLMLEVCETRHDPIDDDTIVADCIGALRAAGFVPESSRVVSRWHRREEHGYPTPFRGRDEVLPCLRRALERHRIFSRGRFGAWLYEISNQDHSFMQGVELVDCLLGEGQEPTLSDPDRVNRRARQQVS